MFALEFEGLVDVLERATRGHEQVPQASFARLGLEVFDELDRLPPIARPDFVMIVGDSGAHMLFDEVTNAVAEKRLAFRKVKIHAVAPACLSPDFGSNWG